MKTILIDYPLLPESVSALRAIPNVHVRLVPEPQEALRPQPAELIRDVDLLLCSYPPENIAEMKALKLIQLTSAGYEHLYGWPLAERGIRVCNGRGLFDIPIAEWIIGMMINLRRDLRGLLRNQERHLWDRDPRFEREIHGMTLGIWGYGGIGRQTARLAKAMGLTVHVMTRSGIPSRKGLYVPDHAGDVEGVLPDRSFTLGEKDAFLAGLDFLALAIPKTPSSVGLIGEAELRRLPRHAFLLNPARGQIVQEPVLLRALREGWIAGAALDAHCEEPLPADHPLWDLPNVYIPPHLAGASQTPAYALRLADLFGRNVRRFLAGDSLLNELTAAQLAGRS